VDALSPSWMAALAGDGGATMGLGIGLVALGTLGLIPASDLFEWMTRLACPVMLVPMLFRLDLYTGSMGHHAHAA